MKTMITVLLFAHFVGDFYLQPDALAKKKEASALWVLIHSAIYTAVMFSTLLLLGGGYIWAAAVCSLTHLIIDSVKFLIAKALEKRGKKPGRAAFCIDQALHLLTVFGAAFFAAGCTKIVFPPYSLALAKRIRMNPYHLLTYFTMILAVIKPANIFVRIMLGGEAENNETSGKTGVAAGRLIGILERILVIVLLVFGQYGSIALVFTAKSIARFKQLDDRSFAEYYIFGTLLSVVSAVGVFLTLKFFGA